MNARGGRGFHLGERRARLSVRAPEPRAGHRELDVATATTATAKAAAAPATARATSGFHLVRRGTRQSVCMPTRPVTTHEVEAVCRTIEQETP